VGASNAPVDEQADRTYARYMAELRLATAERVPFVDLEPVHRGLKTRILADWGELIDTGAFVNGGPVSAFEAAFGAYCQTKLCVGVSSGLDGLRLSLLAAGIERGDEVVVPANTFVATLEAVTQAGGKPVPVDASDTDYNLDVDAVAAAVTPRTRFIVPVHLYGQMADMASLHRIAARDGIDLIEDACQAHGAERDGRRAGATSLAAAFSFYPGKNLGAMGDAGAVVSSSDDLGSRLRALREHGQRAKYRHDVEGFTARLDTIQAIALLHKLPLLDGWNEERRDAARFYDASLEGVGDLLLPPTAPGSAPVWHLYVVRTREPERLQAFLAERQIATGRHYPEPVHLTAAYSWLGYPPGVFPVAEALAREVLSLPMFPGISQRQLETVVAAVSDYFAHG
jgi:dTDP-4-amino-4,6-dideoxygalactose transaminase